jgi:hypothetical protein
MNHKLIRMLGEAGFEFTPDIMAKLPEFEKLIRLEREACAKVCDDIDEEFAERGRATWCADAIRARVNHDD